MKASFSVEDEVVMIAPFFTPLHLDMLGEKLANTFVLGGKTTILIVDGEQKQTVIRYDSRIVSFTVSYMHNEQPYLRYFPGHSLRVFIATAH